MGTRISTQAKAVLNVLAEKRCHLTADEILSSLDNIGTATVYRALDHLTVAAESGGSAVAPHVGDETTQTYVENALDFGRELAELSGLPEAFTSVVKADFCPALAEKHPDKNFFFIENTTRKLF